MGITLVLLMGIAWAILPGGFGLSNFKKKHGAFMNALGTFAWILLITLHLITLYILWSGAHALYWWLLFLFAGLQLPAR